MKINFLSLGKQPIANKFITESEKNFEFFYDLNVGFYRKKVIRIYKKLNK